MSRIPMTDPLSAKVVLGLVFFLLVAATTLEGGETSDHLFELVGSVPPAGETTLVTQYTNSSSGFMLVACSYSLEHDPAALTMIDVQSSIDLDLLQPDFVESNIYAEGVTFGLLLDFTLATFLPPSSEALPLQQVTYQSELMSGEQTSICFNGALGDPYPIQFVVVNDVGETLDLPDACFTYTAQAVDGFTRGDLDGSGAVDALDPDRLLAYLFPASAAVPYEVPMGCNAELQVDGADSNDNEHLTLADYLLLRDSLASESFSIPEPAGCGVDPSEDSRGFDAVDPEYSISIGNPVVMGLPSETRQILFPINLDHPAELAGVLGFTVALSFDSALLSVPIGSSWIGQGTGTVEIYGDTLVLTRYAASGGLLSESPGTLILELDPFQVFPPLDWQPDIVVTAPSDREVRYRATVVDPNHIDHHPRLVNGEYEFVRGNANGDTSVDIGDSIYILDYLFSSQPGPYCQDAADINNDSSVDIGDAIFLLSFLFAGGAPIPAPFPQCGFDDGQIDRLGCAPPGDACE